MNSDSQGFVEYRNFKMFRAFLMTYIVYDTDLNACDHLYVHCVSKERLELLVEGMSCVETRMLSISR